MITEKDLQEAIAECQGTRNPNANTCMMLAAFYTIKDHLFPEEGQDDPQYSYDTEPSTVGAETVNYFSETEFGRAVNGKDVQMACGGFRKAEVNTAKTSLFYLDIDYNSEILDMAVGYEIMSISGIQGYVWNKLYRVEIIKEHELRHDVKFSYAEDHQFNLRYFPNVKKMSLIKDCDYCYLKYGNGMQATFKYHSNIMQMWQGIIELSAHYHRQIGWSETKVAYSKNQMIVLGIRLVFTNIFFSDTSLNVRESITELQIEYFDQTEYVNLIKQGHFGKNNLLRMIQLLTYTNSARMTAVFFYALGFITRKLNVSVN